MIRPIHRSSKALKGPYTFEDFCALVPDGQKADLLNGVIYLASPDNTDSNDLNGWLWSLMKIFAEERQLGKVYGSRVAFRLDGINGPEPDVGFVSKRFLDKVRRGYVEHRPDVAVEIVSHDSIHRDYEDKFSRYELAGVPEYWILDELEKTTRFFRLGVTKNTRKLSCEEAFFTARPFPAFGSIRHGCGRSRGRQSWLP